MGKRNTTTNVGKDKIRTFDTGANRDIDTDKLDFEAFLNPEVLHRYAKYMHKNRYTNDGEIRDGDNWQNLFGDNHQSVCMKSLSRHYMDLWLLHRNYNVRESIEDALAGIMFNTMAIWLGVIENEHTD